MKTYAFLAGIAISMIISAANAQTVNPDSFLGTDQNMEQNVPPQNNQPEAPSAPNPPTPPVAYDLPMTAKCWPMGYLKIMLEREKRIELYDKSIKVLPILVDMEIAGYKINTFEH